MHFAVLLAAVALAGIGLLLLPKSASATAARGEETDPPSENGLPFFRWFDMNADANIGAFLAVIRAVEGGRDSYDYDDLYGGGNFSDFSDHPANKGWAGVRLSNGKKTTAAGAYQITQTTWNAYKDAAGLENFSPASQDAFAIYLLQVRGAYNYVRNGEFEEAVSRLTNEWEAFAKMQAGKYFVTMAQAKEIFNDQGGTAV